MSSRFILMYGLIHLASLGMLLTFHTLRLSIHTYLVIALLLAKLCNNLEYPSSRELGMEGLISSRSLTLIVLIEVLSSSRELDGTSLSYITLRFTTLHIEGKCVPKKGL
jgi:hypothetical protein